MSFLYTDTHRTYGDSSQLLRRAGWSTSVTSFFAALGQLTVELLAERTRIKRRESTRTRLHCSMSATKDTATLLYERHKGYQRYNSTRNGVLSELTVPSHDGPAWHKRALYCRATIEIKPVWFYGITPYAQLISEYEIMWRSKNATFIWNTSAYEEWCLLGCYAAWLL
jgi:hypothetical protein